MVFRTREENKMWRELNKEISNILDPQLAWISSNTLWSRVESTLVPPLFWQIKKGLELEIEEGSDE